jgi:ribosomal protein S18 acetylase RimI-like enzyme
MKLDSNVEIVELEKNEAYLSELKSDYSKVHYYDVSVIGDVEKWRIDLALKPFEGAMTKDYKGRLFEDHVQEPRVFVAVVNGRHVGWIELGYEKWNNRMRVWEFLVDREFRRKGIGTFLMNHALEIAKAKGARMLVLETQTDNVSAIAFYLRFGFRFVGLDTAAYSNEDIQKKEVRLELGLKL